MKATSIWINHRLEMEKQSCSKADWRGRMRSDFGRLSVILGKRVLNFILQSSWESLMSS